MFFVKNKVKSIGILFLVIVLLKILEFFPFVIERVYSTGLYKCIQIVERFIFFLFPFSFGDILYSIAILFGCYCFFKFFKKLFQRKWKEIGNSLLLLVQSILVVYIVFLSNWGLNYSRLGISYQLKMEKATYSTAELQDLAQDLANNSNKYRKLLPIKIEKRSNTDLFKGAENSYTLLERKYTFLNYKVPCVKASIYSELGNYLGFTGYLNPFTGEAQVNTHTPFYQLPYITCHEIAHQLGYATEDEANFVGYLAASNSNDVLFKYSTYADLFRYAINELYLRDSTIAIPIFKNLDTLVKSDFLESKKFYKPYRNKVEHIVTWIYGAYLKANKQPQGIETYNEVISLLISYKKKYHQL